MKKWTKRIGRFLLTVLLSTIVIVMANIVTDGMYLLGVPRAEDVTRVVVAYPLASDGQKEFTDLEKIELACRLTGFLKYVPWEQADESAEPLISITYILEDGTELSAAANNTTVWWKGRAHALKQEDIFIRFAEGIFFEQEQLWEKNTKY